MENRNTNEQEKEKEKEIIHTSVRRAFIDVYVVATGFQSSNSF